MTDPETRAIPVDVVGLCGTLRCAALDLFQANYFPHANATLTAATALETLAAERDAWEAAYNRAVERLTAERDEYWELACRRERALYPNGSAEPSAIETLAAENARLREAPDEDWLADVIQDSIDMDWTGSVGAQAIIRRWGERHGY